MFFYRKNKAEQLACRVKDVVNDHPRTSLAVLGALVTGIALAAGCKYAYACDLDKHY